MASSEILEMRTMSSTPDTVFAFDCQCGGILENRLPGRKMVGRCLFSCGYTPTGIQPHEGAGEGIQPHEGAGVVDEVEGERKK
jgi:hypothetical protein